MTLFTNNARRWLETILEERFGKRFDLLEQPNMLVLRLSGQKGEIKFDHLQSAFHQSRSSFPCKQWQASLEGYVAPIEDEIPAPSESQLPSPLIEVDKQSVFVHYDILGLTYWMLSRLEEVNREDLDGHQRFPATSSHAYKCNYLERPIVDEWLIILGQVILRVWPQVKLKPHQFSIKVSHDVDTPSLYGFKRWTSIGRMMVGHLLKRRDFRACLMAPYIKLSTRSQLNPADPFNTFDWLMDVSEANGLQSAFYFICGRTDPARDADYEPEHPAIRNLMRRIHERGHEIGLHPSYDTFQKPDLIKREADRLKNICAKEGIKQTEWGGRMHYLRWAQSTTMRAWDAAGLSYDSTLGYADRPGFRCGTCHEYPAFDPVGQERLNLRIRPLVVMECTVIDQMYLGLGVSEAADQRIRLLKERSRSVKGTFGLLWHNSYFDDTACKSIYESIIER
ncbi:polysaccharide deacetylase family protein [Marinobacter sp. GN3S48]|uniref:polysaccharide deacetylase family protein n=1 Tax=Marinobacter sp. GN3S48 TaxID=3382302 RepID=UPI00387B96F8